MDTFLSLNGYAKTNNRLQDVQRILDAHIIGLMVDADIEYDSKKRERISQLNFPNNTIKQPLDKIQNYILVELYNESVSYRIFVHGKDLFTDKKAADDFFNSHKKDPEHFNTEIVDRITNVFLPNSFEQRVSRFPINDEEKDKLNLKSLMMDFPHVDFSTVAQSKLSTPREVFQILTLLQENGVNIAHEMQKRADLERSDPSMDLLVKEKLINEIPRQLDNYLSEKSSSSSEQQLKTQWGEELKIYVAQHQYDWEIINNFKTAAAMQSQDYQSLQQILVAGAKKRAESILVEKAQKLGNPYGQPFTQLEPAMASIMVDSIKPNILKWSIEKRLPVVIVDEFSIQNVFSKGAQLVGKHHNAANQDFDDVIYCAAPDLSHNQLSWLANHEMRHALDNQKGELSFSYQFDEILPAMIKNDGYNLQNLIQWVNEVDDNCPSDQMEILQTLGRMRGIKTDDRKDVKFLKEEILTALIDIRSLSLLSFTDSEKNTDYGHQALQHIEVPAVVSQLKGQYQENFVNTAFPNLSQAVKIDEAIKIDDHKDPVKTAKLQALAIQFKQRIAQSAISSEPFNANRISSLIKKKSGLQI